MKKLLWIFTGVITISLVYSYLNVQAENQAPPDYVVVIRYNPYSTGSAKQHVFVSHSDGEEQIELTKEQATKTTGFVIGLMTKYNAEGYELISTTNDVGGRVNCFLRKQN